MASLKFRHYTTEAALKGTKSTIQEALNTFDIGDIVFIDDVQKQYIITGKNNNVVTYKIYYGKSAVVGISGSGAERTLTWSDGSETKVTINNVAHATNADSAGSASTAGYASNADQLDGLDSTAFARAEHTHTLPHTSIEWSSSSIADMTPIDMAVSANHNANRLAFINPSGITIEYSRNGGSSWVDYGANNASKINLVSGIGSSFSIGAKSSGVTVNDKLRVTINATNCGVYTAARRIYMNISSNGASGCSVKFEYSNKGSESTFKTLGTYSIYGWSGWNSIPINANFGGRSDQTSNWAVIRFTFGITGLSSSYSNNLSLLDLQLHGNSYWAYPSNMSKTGHLYSWDNAQNATFPADISATNFRGTLVGTASKATTLQTSRKINGTNFNGSADITTSKWGTSKNIGIVNSDGTGTAVPVSIDGSSNTNLKLPATIKASLDGNASTSSKWANSRTLTLTGSVTGSVSIDGSANVSLNTKTNHSHTFASLTSKPTTISGYGITDAKINNTTITIGSASLTTVTPAISTTYANLVSLRNSGSLIPGQQYRITDYKTTTTTTNTNSANHYFDVIVTADSANKLNEEAKATQSARDTANYFTNCNLNAWKIWYCLDNDTNRFEWANSTNGTGVIYRMIDEKNNDVPYDFKNIRFKRGLTNGLYDSNATLSWVYTFNAYDKNNSVIEDAWKACEKSAENKCYNNIIKPYYNGSKQALNKIIFTNVYNSSDHFTCFSNTFGYNCWENVFSDSCSGNTFGDLCTNNTFGERCTGNTFGIDCWDNIFGNYITLNIFGDYFYMNVLGSMYVSNTFGEYCSHIYFASNTTATSTKYDGYQGNHFGDNCEYICFKGEDTLTDGTGSVRFIQNYNFAQGLCGTSDGFLTINGVRNRDFETKVAKNSLGELKTYCEADLIL